MKRDPLDVRRANYYGIGERDTTPYGQKVEDNIIAPLTDELLESSDYRARRAAIAAFNAKSPVLKRGIAFSPVKFGISFNVPFLNQAGALVHVYKDGSVLVNHGGTEMGQGLNTKVAQVVANAARRAAFPRARDGDRYVEGREYVGDRRLDGQRPERQGRRSRRADDPRAACGTRREATRRHGGRSANSPTASCRSNGGAMPFEQLVARGVSGARAIVVRRFLRDAESALGREDADRSSVLLLRVRCGGVGSGRSTR